MRSNRQKPRCPILWSLSILFAIVGTGAPAVVAQTATSRRPNILFIFSDDHAAQSISAYGSRINKTPNLDRLASQGMLFRNCFCTNSICAPSRAVILTGKHSHLNGIVDNRLAFDGAQQTFPKLLQGAGYQTAMIGKWHLKTHPTGFDYWRVLPGQGTYYNPVFITPEGKVQQTGYVTDIITDLTLEWLKNGRDADKPFMIMSQHKAPHRSWLPGPKHLTMYDDVTIPEPATLFDDWSGRSSAAGMQEMTIANHMGLGGDLMVHPIEGTPEDDAKRFNNVYQRFTDEQRQAWDAAFKPKNESFRKANLSGKDLIRWKYQRYIKDYLRCIASVDDNIGRLLDYLEESGLAKNTVVIYSSDQGFYLGEHGWYDKRWMFEESLRMPFIVRWPGVTKPGSENRHLVQNLDFAETFLAMAGAEIPADMQGRSILPLLKGKDPDDWRKSIYYHYWEYPAVHMVNRHYGVRTDRYKLIHYYQLDEWELFDLQKDPQELHSVYKDFAYEHIVTALKAELSRLQQLYKDTDPDRPCEELGRTPQPSAAAPIKPEKVLQLDAPGTDIPQNLDPSNKPLTVGACCIAQTGNGVIIAQGGAELGYSLYLKEGVPHFAVRSNGVLKQVACDKAIPLNEKTHIAGILTEQGAIELYLNGQRVVQGKGHFISRRPADGLTIAADTGSFVAAYDNPMAFKGNLKDVRVYWGRPGNTEFNQWATAGR